MTGIVWGQASGEIDPELSRLHKQWQDQFWSYLETSEYAQFRTASGIHLLQTGDPKSVERGLELIEEVLSSPGPDPASLWQLASECQFRTIADWCEPGGVYEMLMQADPANAAVMMLRFSHAKLGNDEMLLDTEANRQLLVQAAQVDRFDVYWGRGADKLYEEALKFVEVNPVPPIPEPWSNFAPHEYAFTAAMGMFLMAPTSSYLNTSRLCRIQARNKVSKTIKACNKLARTLRDNGLTNVTRGVGYGMTSFMSKAIDPDDPQIRSWQLRGRVFSLVQICFMPRWQLKPDPILRASMDTIMNWAKNLDELGEWEGNRLTSMQEYSASPGDYAVNPADCDKLLDLDDEAMARLVGGRDPYAAWMAMQAEAGSNQ